MGDRDESRRHGYGPHGSHGAGQRREPRDQEALDEDDWRRGSRLVHGSDRGWDRVGGWRAEPAPVPPDSDSGSEREPAGYGPAQGEGYRGGYNLGMNYGQGGPQGQGFGQGGEEDPRENYGGFGYQGYHSSQGSWRQGRWEPGPPAGEPSHGTPFATGYSDGRQPRPPRGYQRSDERIREEVCDTIVRMGIDAGDVDITVEDGEVRLSGTVDNRRDKRRLEDLAELVPGVKHVTNALRVEDHEQPQPPQSTPTHH
jgi:hypothetical protein